MRIDDCKERVKRQFPFPEYVNNTLQNGVVDNVSNTIIKYLPEGSKILDFGSGPCEKTAVIQFLGYECSAYDDLCDDWHREGDNLSKIIAFTEKIGIDFKLAGEEYLPFRKEYFDMVMSHDVLEHLHDSPRDVLNDLCELLKPNGLLFITVPNAVNIRKRIAVLKGQSNLPDYGTFYWYPGAWRGHVREYVKRDFELLVQYLNFEILELRSCHHMLNRIPSKIRPIYLMLTSFFTGWRDSWLLVARKPSDWKPKKTISPEEFRKIMAPVSAYYKQ
ncbi:Methyltransferase domain-containing protein [Candidatus Electrothrix laxa]